MYHKLLHFKDQLKTVAAINRDLTSRVESSSTSGDDFFIRLNNDKRFTGFPAKKHFRRLHPFLNKKLRSKVTPELMQVLFDLHFRYVCSGGHPQNLKEGKYLKLNRGDVVFEIGAYIGHHAMRMAEIVGETGRVAAVEAIPANFEYLRKNVELNELKNVTPINLAVWNAKGTIAMNMDENQKNSAVDDVVKAKHSADLPCDTIDNIYADMDLDRVDFVRIQTNGAELEALKGMESILDKKPKILVAVPYKNKERIQNLLDRRGYRTTYTGHSILAE